MIAFVSGLFVASPCSGQTEAATAYAFPVGNITIDGNLDDWPDDFVSYPVLTSFRVYGDTDIDFADLSGSADLTPIFRVGYNADDGLVYVAAMVRDENHVVGQGDEDTDAMEVYVEGTHRHRNRYGDVTALQYFAVAGKGSYSGPRNPGMCRGLPIEKTRTRFAYGRRGDVTIYEWAVEPFDHFPDKPTELKPGKRIGFEVVIIDRDHPADPTAFVCWGPLGGWKYSNASLLGDLVLLGEQEVLCHLTGTVRRVTDQKPMGDLIIEAFRGDQPAGTAHTDAQGRFSMQLPPGHYALRPARWQAIKRYDPTTVELSADSETEAQLTVSPIDVPQALRRTAEAYRGLTGYQDRTTLRTDVAQGTEQVSLAVPIGFRFARPNRIHIHSPSLMLGLPTVVCDGKETFTVLQPTGPQPQGGAVGPIKRQAPEVLTPRMLRRAMAQSGHYWSFRRLSGSANAMVPVANFGQMRLQGSASGPGVFNAIYPHRLVLSPDPLAELRIGAESIRETGREELDGEPVRVVEITKRAAFVLTAMFPCGPGVGQPVNLRLWISERDDLIRKVRFRIDRSVLEGAPASADKTGNQLITYTSEHREVRADPKFDTDAFQISADLAKPVTCDTLPPGAAKPSRFRFTVRARKVMTLANQEAHRLNQEYIGTEHLLLGLLKEETGIGSNVLVYRGLDLRRGISRSPSS